MARKTTTPDAPTAPQFAIIERGVVLSDRRKAKRDPQRYSKPVVGDVARLSDGRLIARFVRAGSDGTPLWQYIPYDPEVDVSTVYLPAPTDWGERLRSKTEQIRGGHHTLLERNEVLEVQRFRREFPSIAALPGLSGQLEAVVPYQSSRLFEPGSVLYPIATEGVSFNTEWWRHWVELHASGDWGVHGHHVDKRYTDEDLWTRDEMAQNVQNSIACGTRSGACLSRWILGEEAQVRWLKPQLSYSELGERPTRCVDIITAFLRGGARTLCTIEQQRS
jgi:hypothetical protein